MDCGPSALPGYEESREEFMALKESRRGNPTSSCGQHDSSGVSSRCSVRLIHDIVSRFSPTQAELVRSIGFGGLLHMPLLKQINLRFSSWVMSRVDVLTQTLMISEDIRIQFDKSDVAKVFGIPNSGKSILSSSVSELELGSESSRAGGGINTSQLRSIKAAQAILSRSSGGVMSQVEQDEFKAAFVVVVMSSLLAPAAKHDRVGDDYMHAIAYPAEISSFDWSEYVIRRLLDAVSKLKLDTANNVKTPYIYGCSLFLQVFFLDSIELGVLSVPHNLLPRIRSFTADRLRSMIAVVSTVSANGTDITVSRVTKLRNRHDVCYHWASSELPSPSVPNDSGMVHLWDAVLLMTRVLKIPLEAAGPLFIAVADIQRRNSSQSGTEALDDLCVLMHIMEPYVNGFSYKTSVNANAHMTGRCHLSQQHRCSRIGCCMEGDAINCMRNISSSSQIGAPACKRKYSTIQKYVNYNVGRCIQRTDIYQEKEAGQEFSAPVFLNGHDFDMRAMNVMARFYMMLRPVRVTRCCDLNAPSSLEGSCLERAAPISPWDLGHTVNIDVSRSADLWRKLAFVEDIDEPWIVHSCPKYIEVLTCSLKSQIAGESEFEMELFDAVIRRYKQLDDVAYSNEHRLRWRHYVESDFMEALLAGWFDIADPVVHAHFCSRHIVYDVTSCEIIFFPALLHYRWVCFAWRMKDNTIVIYDPSSSQMSIGASECSYQSVVGLLKSGMSMVASRCLHRWGNEWSKAGIEFFIPSETHYASINQSGLLCLYFCRCFDGQRLIPPLSEVDLQDWAANVLGEVSALSGNLGSVPPMFS